MPTDKPTRTHRGGTAFADDRPFRGTVGSGARGRARRRIGRRQALAPRDREALRLLRETLFPTDTRVPTKRRRARGAEDREAVGDDVLANPELSKMMQATATSDACETAAGDHAAPEAAGADSPVPADDGQFLTSEELQSLGDVFGHFPISGETYDDQTTLGFPPSGWQTVQEELRTLRFSLDDLRTDLSEFDALRGLLAEIKTEVVIGHRSREALASSLVGLTGDVQELREKLEATSRSAVASARSVNRIENRFEGSARAGGHRELPDLLRRCGSPATVGLAAAAVLAASLLMVLYLSTGDLRITLLALIAANFVGCAAMLVGRRRRWA